MFTFMYYNRLFEFQTAKPVETQMWVLCLNFLHKHSQYSNVSIQPWKYFTNYNDVVKVRDQEDDAQGEESGAPRQVPGDQQGQDAEAERNKLSKALAENKKKKRTKKKTKPLENHKFENIDALAFSAIVHHSRAISFMYDEDQIKLSRRALITKNIWSYLQSMNFDLMKSRVIFGFLRKRSSGRVQILVNRWWFLISSRPLSIDEFIRDDSVLTENELPPLLEFDTMYYYYMNS